MEPNNITLIGWVNQAFEQSFTKKNLKLDLGIVVHGLSTPRQWTTKLNPKRT
jgi:hypothetical protein